MKDRQKVITILGSAGGAAKSILSILNQSAVDQHDPIHHFIADCTFHFIDNRQKKVPYYHHLFPHLKDRFILHEFELQDTKTFTHHLQSTKTDIVIDTSWANTVEMLKCCDRLGVKYINSALEHVRTDENEEKYEGFSLIEAIRHFEKYKNSFVNTSAIVCAGMNPGVVQWMAIELLKQHPQETPRGCYIVEHDSSFFKDKQKAKENVLYTTWSPECFLHEAVLSYPMFMKHHTPHFLDENVYDLEFKVTLGNRQFYGCLMPHEEVYTLGKLYNMESGFLYKVNDHTTGVIRSNLDDISKLRDGEMEVLDPLDAALEGEDLVGVLMIYQDKERYMYNAASNESAFSQYKTNATYFQVACGLYASLCVLLMDEIPTGVYYVDELLLQTTNRYGHYLTYYMTDFVKGENDHTDGLLFQRIRKMD